MTLDCYNTCFTLENNEKEHILVDTGGGLQIIKQLRDAKIDFRKIHNIILSHKHTDHILGMFWIIRYAQKFTKLMDKSSIFNIVEDKEEIKILNYNIKFLDVQSKKDRQFGFKTTLTNGKTFVFLGDETFDEKIRDEVDK